MYENVKKYPTKIYGLKYRPSLEPEYSDDGLMVREFFNLIKRKHRGLQEKDTKLLTEQFLSIKDKIKCIVEIGVGWKKEGVQRDAWEFKPGEEELKWTSTQIFLSLKNKETTYLGIDIHNRKYLNNKKENIYTLRTDSRNITSVMNFLRKKGIFEIDFLFIDGFHSVNMVTNDWQYSKYLSKNGIIMMHDTNIHPGVYTVFDAIDETLFKKKKYFVGAKDSYGMGVIKRC